MLMTIITAATMMCAQEQTPKPIPARTVQVLQRIQPGEAVEFTLENTQDGDAVTWLILHPTDEDFQIFNHTTSFIVDPAIGYYGRIKVVCRVVNFDTRETLDLEASTMVEEPMGGGGQSVESNETPVPGVVTMLHSISAEAAPGFDGVVYGSWNKAAKALAANKDINDVNKQLAADLNAGALVGWATHYQQVFDYISKEGTPTNRADLYAAVASGVLSLKSVK